MLSETMQNYISSTAKIIVPATLDTLIVVFYSSLFSILFGMIIGISLYITEKDSIMEQKIINKVLSFIVNIGRSIPFIIIIIAVLPLSKLIVGTSIGRTAFIVPLTIAAITFVGRIVENALKELDKGVIEAAKSFGASNVEIIFKVLLPETASSIVDGITLAIINIIGYSAMAGTIGGGGLGDVAIRFGYLKFKYDLLVITIIIIVILVQIVQALGTFISRKLDKKR